VGPNDIELSGPGEALGYDPPTANGIAPAGRATDMIGSHDSPSLPDEG